MSRRTAEANKAIVAAWEREQQLVNEGKGTRDWTTEQQIDILEKGKAYDYDGRALEGHHMKSVTAFPEHQGNPDNIQFLSRSEHFEAHGGSFQNPTNGYYNPIERMTIIFTDDNLIPCEIIKLSNPVVDFNKNPTDDSGKISEETRIDSEIDVDKAIDNNKKTTDASIRNSEQYLKNNKSEKEDKFIFQGFHKVKNAFRNFEINHPVATEVIKTVGPIVAEIAITYGASVAMNVTSSKTSTNHSGLKSPSRKTNDGSKTIENVASAISKATEKSTHASPIKHTVSGYTRHVNGKEIHVSSYVRGGKTNK